MQLLLVHIRLFIILSMSGRVANKMEIVIIPITRRKQHTANRRVNFLKILIILHNKFKQILIEN